MTDPFIRTPAEVVLDAELIDAAQEGDIDRVRHALDAGASVWAGDRMHTHFAAVIGAAAAGRIDVVRFFFEEYRDSRDRPLMMGRFSFSDAFAAALMHRHTNVADIMLGVHPNEINEQSRLSRKFHEPFALAINSDDVATFDWMIDHGIMPYRSELRTAINRGSAHMVESMLMTGVEWSHINVERINSPEVRHVFERWRALWNVHLLMDRSREHSSAQSRARWVSPHR